MEKENADLKVKKKEQLDEAEQRGYDLYFEEHVEAIKKIQRQLFQAGYNFRLNAALIPSTSALRVLVSTPGDFKYVDEDDEEDGEDVSSKTDDREGTKEASAGCTVGEQGGGNAERTPPVMLTRLPFLFPLRFFFSCYFLVAL